MLEPLTAIGLAGTLIQFVDFSSKIVIKAGAIYASADGALPENQDAETVAQSLQVLDAKIRAGLATSSGTKSEEALKELCGECDSVAQELLKALEKLKIYDRKTRWKSMRQALKSVTSKTKVDNISKRLENLRDQLSLSFLVELSGKIDLVSVANAHSFSDLESTTQAIITSILQHSSDFDAAIIAQTADIKELHDEDRNISESQHNNIINTIKDTSQISQSHSTEEHEKTREEVSQLKDGAAKLKNDMEKEFAELKALIKATAEAKGDKQQKALKEKATAASASWLAKDIIYSNLMDEVAPRSFPSLTKLVEGFGFREPPEKLPKSLQIAMANRLTKGQVQDLTSQRHGPYFCAGAFMYPAGLWCLTPRTANMSLRDVANSMTPATLRGYTRYAVRSQDWPALYPASSVYSEVKGMVFFGFHEYHQIVQEFQAGMYDRKKVMVEIELADLSSMQIEVDIYVWNDDFYKLCSLMEKVWSPTDFLKSPCYEPIMKACAQAEESLELETHEDIVPKS